MNKYLILHNPRCSKSRETLGLLDSHGIKPQIIDYLNGGLNRELLETIISSVGVKELLRTKEEVFAGLALDLENREKVIEAILAHPVILERPIFLNGKKAVIGRPPENVLKMI